MGQTEALSPGTLFDGRYEVVRLVGQGGMATVYQVRHLGLRSTHALKILTEERARDRDLRERFLAEGRIQAKLRHPNLVQVTDVVTVPSAGLVMDFVEGPTLAQYSQQYGMLGQAGALELFHQVLDAVGTAHRAGVIHRDLKPENIIIGTDNRNRMQPKVTDFGLAKVLGPGRQEATQTGIVMGTPLYMSPEQVRSARNVTTRSDIFSLGIILYELLTGRQCFYGQNNLEIMRRISRGEFAPPEVAYPPIDRNLSAIICRALDVDPEGRYESCEQFSSALEAASRLGTSRRSLEMPVAVKLVPTHVGTQQAEKSTLPAESVKPMGRVDVAVRGSRVKNNLMSLVTVVSGFGLLGVLMGVLTGFLLLVLLVAFRGC
jgi:serine/threonine-protein kinase